jgi:hypothetical protein
VQGTEFEEDAKKQGSDMWDLAKKMQDELVEMTSQPAPKRARTSNDESEQQE